MKKRTVALSILCISIIIFSACKKEKKEGCTDSSATNYNAEAEVDDGTCQYPEPIVVKGCMDAEAVNYNGEATEEDGSCQYAEEKQNALFVEVTGSWCPPCGSNGGPFFNSVNANYGDDLIALAVHVPSQYASDPMQVDQIWNDFLSTVFSVSGVPSFFINHEQLGYNTQMSQVETIIDGKISSDPLMATGFRTTLDGSEFTIDYKVQIFQEVDAEYYLAFYAVEDGIPATGVYSQASGAAGYEHNHTVIAPTSNTWGEVLLDGEAEPGEILEGQTSLSVNAHNDINNVHIVSVIWEKKSYVNYQYVNANKELSHN